jgi:hypothetical protein
MKKFSLLVFILFVSTQIQAQEFRAFLPFGFNASQLDRDLLSGYNKVGFVGGMGVMNKFKSENSFFQMEILYSRKGSRSSEKEIFNFNRYRLNYIEMPIQGYYYVHPKIALGGGLYWGFLINARKDDGGGFYEFTDSPLVKKLDLGYTAGILFKISEKTEFNARFSYSIDNFRNPQFINNVLTYTLRIYLTEPKAQKQNN